MADKQSSFAAAIPPPSNTLAASIRIHLSCSLLHSPLAPSSFTLAQPLLLYAGLPPCEPVGARGCCGRATLGRLPAISDHQRVRAALLMLHHHSTVADKLPPADIDKLQCLLCSCSRQGPHLEIRGKEGA